MSNIATSIRSSTNWLPESAIGRIRHFIATYARLYFRKTGAVISRHRAISASDDDRAAVQARLLRPRLVAGTADYAFGSNPPYTLPLPHRPRVTLQRKRLVAEHGLDDDVAGSALVERVLVDQVAAFGDDLIGILHDLELLVAIMPS